MTRTGDVIVLPFFGGVITMKMARLKPDTMDQARYRDWRIETVSSPTVIVPTRVTAWPMYGATL
jgi:hypothetical protein